jgi:class 3 adenylate cyclase
VRAPCSDSVVLCAPEAPITTSIAALCTARAAVGISFGECSRPAIIWGKVNERGGSCPGEASVDITAWLHGLGLQQYEATFRDNAIDAEVLTELTEADLEKLGVLLGHRKKLVKAIDELRAPPSEVNRAPRADRPERRQLTVMFCDLVGSTALAVRLDPEDLREVVGAYHRYISDAITPFGGFVAKYMGDGALIYFGYPRAHEDDAEHAARAALALIGNGSGIPVDGDALQMRIGIATGIAVVGDLIGIGAAKEEAVIGEMPNLAARLQVLAEPNTIVIAESTRRLVGSLFDLADLGQQEFKGFTEPQRAWRVIAPSRIPSRFEALRAVTTPLVGRQEELELLCRCWSEAKSGHGHVVLLSGEPGIGKSRLITALQDRLREEPHTRIRYFCSPNHQDSALRSSRSCLFSRRNGAGLHFAAIGR